LAKTRDKRKSGIMKKGLRFTLLVAVVLLLVLVAGAFFFLGAIVKTGVEKAGPLITKTPVTLDGATVSLFNGSGTLKGFTVANPEGFKTPNAIRVGSVGVSLVPGSLFSSKVVVRRVRVDAPEITYEAALGGSNIGKLLDNIKSVASQEKTGGSTNTAAGKALQVDEFLVTGGKIHVGASVLGGGTATLDLPEIRLANLGQGPAGITPAELSEKVFGQIVDSTAKLVMQNAAKIGGEVTEKAKNIGTDAADRLKKAGSGVSDLLKNKLK
jgi:hypothetical protein